MPITGGSCPTVAVCRWRSGCTSSRMCLHVRAPVILSCPMTIMFLWSHAGEDPHPRTEVYGARALALDAVL